MLTVVAAILLSIVALLAIPVTVSFQVSWPQVSHNDVRLRWAFGLVRVRIPSSPPEAHRPKGGTTQRNGHRAKRKGGKKGNFLAVARHKPFRQRIKRFSSDLWRSLRKDNVRLRVRIGLEDPADTGQLWALLGPVAGILANTRGVSISMEPDFLDTTFALDSAGKVRVIPLHTIYLTIGLLLSPAVWRAVRKMRRSGH